VIGNKVFRKIFEGEKNDVREKYGILLKKDIATYIGHLTVLGQWDPGNYDILDMRTSWGGSSCEDKIQTGGEIGCKGGNWVELASDFVQ
jgi:hypothetical protein